MNRYALVQHAGAQRDIFRTGRADAALSLIDFSHLSDLYALGPVAGLDGEITIFNSQAYVSRVRGAEDAFVVDRTFNHAAIFLAWTQVSEWQDVRVPSSVSNNRELEVFARQAAEHAGLDVEAPFPFLMSGTPRRLAWHINVDRTDGQPITIDSFRKSKQPYALSGEQVDIFGVYSDRHAGIFIGEGMKIHIHFVSRDSAATGHIDELDPGLLTLRLPGRSDRA